MFVFEELSCLFCYALLLYSFSFLSSTLRAVIRDGLHYLTMSLDEVRHSVPTPPITEKILTLKQILEAQLNLH